MSDQAVRRLTPVTAGMAMALLMLGLVVGRSASATVTRCQVCSAEANQAAMAAGCQNMMPPEAKMGCFWQYYNQKCLQTGRCPDDTNAYVTCTSTLCADYQESGCPNAQSLGAGTICTGTCSNNSCDSKDTSKVCKLVQVNFGLVGPTNCRDACGCSN
jgi:hypothetical protein